MINARKNNLASQPAATPQLPATPGSLDPNDPWAVNARRLGIGVPTGTPTRSDDESERMGEGQSRVTKPLTTSLLGWGEYRQGATGLEKGAEKFGSGFLSPLSVALMVVTGGHRLLSLCAVGYNTSNIWGVPMCCARCSSPNETEVSAEMMIHFSDPNHLSEPGYLMFTMVLVCLDCGASRFNTPTEELWLLRQSAARSEAA